MANMSYCRFQNTNNDLQDCLNTLEDGEALSKEEFAACKDMFETFIYYCCNEGIIEDEDGTLDERLAEFFESINKE